jgi:4-hydroxy-2-oxoglutarate aldolase
MILPALTTPFADGEVSVGRLRDNIARYERLPLAGYLVLGSTGETVLLDARERGRVLDAARAAIPSSKLLVAGVSAESTREAIRQAREFGDRGADLLLVGTPHYYGEQMTADALTAHFTQVADASSRPVLLYNVPRFTGLAIPPGVVFEMSRHDNVAGLKESSGDLAYMKEILSNTGDGFRVFCGASGILSSALDAGAAGAILAAAVVFPEPFLDVARGVVDSPRAIATAARVVAGDHGIPGLKAAMDHRGLEGGSVRSPLRRVSSETAAEIARIIDALVEDGTLPGRSWSTV